MAQTTLKPHIVSTLVDAEAFLKRLVEQVDKPTPREIKDLLEKVRGCLLYYVR